MTSREYTDRVDAFEVLYTTDTMRRTEPDTSGISKRSVGLVNGVLKHRDSIDGAINAAAIGWTVSRMPVVDRSILRLASFELMYSDISQAIVINEAVDLAKEYSTAGSGKFVNGVLDTLAQTVRDPAWSDPVLAVAEADPKEPNG